MEYLNRLQVAIRLPEQLTQALDEVQKKIRWRAGSEAVRWTPPGEMTLQLLALGEVALPAMARIKDAIAPILNAAPPMQFTVEGVGGAPTVLQPRLIFANLKGDLDKLAGLHDKLERAVKPLCPDHEARPFEPHIALGRLKQQDERDRTALGRAVKISAVAHIGAWTCNQAELLRTAGSTAGPTLVPEAVYVFGGTAVEPPKPTVWSNDPLKP